MHFPTTALSSRSTGVQSFITEERAINMDHVCPMLFTSAGWMVPGFAHTMALRRASSLFSALFTTTSAASSSNPSPRQLKEMAVKDFVNVGV